MVTHPTFSGLANKRMQATSGALAQPRLQEQPRFKLNHEARALDRAARA